MENNYCQQVIHESLAHPQEESFSLTALSVEYSADHQPLFSVEVGGVYA